MSDTFYETARYGIGLLVFNPTDDPAHLERIQKALESVIRAADFARGLNVRLLIGLNQSHVEQLGVPGLGPKTLEWVEAFASRHPDRVLLLPMTERNSNVYCYNQLLKKWHAESRAERIAIFADDYIVPRNWFMTVDREFQRYPGTAFVMPSTCFVPQENLWVPFPIPTHWELVKSREGVPMGVRTGVTFDDVDRIARSVGRFPGFRFIGPPSFETTVFTRKFLDDHGLLHDGYFTTFYNIEYFDRATAHGAVGHVSRRAFVFHHGKGGTAALYRETRDEKYRGSPVELKLRRDVELYNERNGKKMTYFWEEAGEGKALQSSYPSNLRILGFMARYSLMGQLKAYPQIYSAARSVYRALRTALAGKR